MSKAGLCALCRCDHPGCGCSPCAAEPARLPAIYGWCGRCNDLDELIGGVCEMCALGQEIGRDAPGEGE